MQIKAKHFFTPLRVKTVRHAHELFNDGFHTILGRNQRVVMNEDIFRQVMKSRDLPEHLTIKVKGAIDENVTIFGYEGSKIIADTFKKGVDLHGGFIFKAKKVIGEFQANNTFAMVESIKGKVSFVNRATLQADKLKGSAVLSTGAKAYINDMTGNMKTNSIHARAVVNNLKGDATASHGILEVYNHISGAVKELFGGEVYTSRKSVPDSWLEYFKDIAKFAKYKAFAN